MIIKGHFDFTFRNSKFLRDLINDEITFPKFKVLHWQKILTSKTRTGFYQFFSSSYL